MVSFAMVFLQRSECVVEDPFRDVFSKPPSVDIGGAGMNPLVDADFDNLERGIVKTSIGP